ncbi:MAG: stage V sporulation protein AD [Ruminococcaceae bacterium]|nr:stage V sporulation protein AD [Oscillospiraceae bacterium]
MNMNMNKKIGLQTIKLDSKPVIIETFSSVGKKEGEGPLKDYFHKVHQDEFLNKPTWEQAETELMRTTVLGAVSNAQIKFSDIDYIFAGDLINQCTSSSFAIKDFGIPFFGIFGACSTMAEGLSLASIMVDAGYAKKTICTTSSHFCGAEKQFRFPVEYGSVRTPTSQWTVTGSGAAILSKEGEGPKVTHITTGKIVDMGVSDANNMGAAMAPAACDTIYTHLKDTNRHPSYYDLIVTGDLADIGSKLVCDLLKRQGVDISKNHKDCGSMIFDTKEQKVDAGGSGCGCCGSVFCSYLYHLLKNKKIKNLLLVATGALMNPVSSCQGQSIPSIAHAVAIES